MSEKPNHPLPDSTDEEREAVAREQIASCGDLDLLRYAPAGFHRTLSEAERRIVAEFDRHKDDAALKALAKRYGEWTPQPIEPDFDFEFGFREPRWVFACNGFSVYEVLYRESKSVLCVCSERDGERHLLPYYDRDAKIVEAMSPNVRTAICGYQHRARWVPER